MPYPKVVRATPERTEREHIFHVIVRHHRQCFSRWYLPFLPLLSSDLTEHLSKECRSKKYYKVTFGYVNASA